jgi:hypothetical protein
MLIHHAATGALLLQLCCNSLRRETKRLQMGFAVSRFESRRFTLGRRTFADLRGLVA